jgi:hypothetical protein
MKTNGVLIGAAFATAVAASAVGGAANAQIVIGGPGDAMNGNCYPFGCPTSDWGPEYQQVYAAADFGGPITISEISFYNHNFLIPGFTGPIDSGTFTISLSTTSAAVDGLDFTNLANNIGANNTVVFSGSLPALTGPGGQGGQLNLVLSTPFTFDPGAGNLLLDVVSTDAANDGLNAYLDADNGDATGEFSRTYTQGGGIYDNDYGLVTGFNIATTVPEPATWAMMLVGFGGLGLALRSRRHKAVTA